MYFMANSRLVSRLLDSSPSFACLSFSQLICSPFCTECTVAHVQTGCLAYPNALARRSRPRLAMGSRATHRGGHRYPGWQWYPGQLHTWRKRALVTHLSSETLRRRKKKKRRGKKCFLHFCLPTSIVSRRLACGRFQVCSLVSIMEFHTQDRHFLHKTMRGRPGSLLSGPAFLGCISCFIYCLKCPSVLQNFDPCRFLRIKRFFVCQVHSFLFFYCFCVYHLSNSLLTSR